MLTVSPHGLYCEAGGFHVDPSRGVERAIITHAHSDHARRGSRQYLCAEGGQGVLRIRLGDDANIQTLVYGEELTLGGVKVSLHPAGHILGSAQVRIEHRGEVWVVTGDYKREGDPTCRPFEQLRCHTVITESTFGRPFYQWGPVEEVFADIHDWWRSNQRAGRVSLLHGYSLGKAQRLLAGLDPSMGPIFTHESVEKFNQAYREAGVSLPPTADIACVDERTDLTRAIIIAPPSAKVLPEDRRYETYSATASGWMLLRRDRLWGAERGFVLSDHADWPGLINTVKETGAEHVWVSHGYVTPVVRHLNSLGFDARGLYPASKLRGKAAARGSRPYAQGHLWEDE